LTLSWYIGGQMSSVGHGLETYLWGWEPKKKKKKKKKKKQEKQAC